MSQKTLDYYKSLDYGVIIKHEFEEDANWYIAYCEEFGLFACHGKGATPSEAYDSFIIEKNAFISFLYEKGEIIPEPISEIENLSGIFTVRTSPWMHKLLTKQAKVYNISVNSYINQLISYGVGCNNIASNFEKSICKLQSRLEEKSEIILKEINSLHYSGLDMIKGEKPIRKKNDYYQLAS